MDKTAPTIMAVVGLADVVSRQWGPDLTAARGTPALAGAAKRLNMEQSGYRSLLMNTARKLQLAPGRSARDAVLAQRPGRAGS